MSSPYLVLRLGGVAVYPHSPFTPARDVGRRRRHPLRYSPKCFPVAAAARPWLSAVQAHRSRSKHTDYFLRNRQERATAAVMGRLAIVRITRSSRASPNTLATSAVRSAPYSVQQKSEDSAMSQTKEAAQSKRRTNAGPVLAAASLSFSLASGSSAAIGAANPDPATLLKLRSEARKPKGVQS